jgi:hypothetical protein
VARALIDKSDAAGQILDEMVAIMRNAESI